MARTFPIKMRRCTVGLLELCPEAPEWAPLVTVHGNTVTKEETFVLQYSFRTKEKAAQFLFKALGRGWGERTYWFTLTGGYDAERFTDIREFVMRPEQ